ncbi:hypothetical protein KSP39_PZI009408 [Platanthera zijinensis]|uniref:Uncharacterized protein n=1 Tax=Platanthera zijinensis TaxID=2320716 RepID=A0AAP0G767_9ASPA
MDRPISSDRIHESGTGKVRRIYAAAMLHDYFLNDWTEFTKTSCGKNGRVSHSESVIETFPPAGFFVFKTICKLQISILNRIRIGVFPSRLPLPKVSPCLYRLLYGVPRPCTVRLVLARCALLFARCELTVTDSSLLFVARYSSLFTVRCGLLLAARCSRGLPFACCSLFVACCGLFLPRGCQSSPLARLACCGRGSPIVSCLFQVAFALATKIIQLSTFCRLSRFERFPCSLTFSSRATACPLSLVRCGLSCRGLIASRLSVVAWALSAVPLLRASPCDFFSLVAARSLLAA